jgi:hypothetical protein
VWQASAYRIFETLNHDVIVYVGFSNLEGYGTCGE